MQATPSPGPPISPHPPPISPHPAGPYSRYSPGQPLVTGALPAAHSPIPPVTPQPVGAPLPPAPQVPPSATLAPQANYAGGLRPPPIGIPPASATSSYYPPAPPTGVLGSRKRLIVACDGTWLDADSGLKDKQVPVPSNVTRISRAIKSLSSDRIPQVVYYQAGVGSVGGPIAKTVGGAVGSGLADNVHQGYSFLATNYSPGDEIFLLGFSRGAFTARSIGGLIAAVGLLTKPGLDSLGVVFEDYEHRRDKNYDSPYPNVPFQNKPSASDPAYKNELYSRGLTRLGIRIKAIGVWETVGSLGIPRVPWLERLGLQSKKMKAYSFYDTGLDESIEYAFQALALDEERASFSPAIWEKSSKSPTVLRQVWFPGVHSNVGGGYPDQEISNITLAWMIAQLEPFIDFHPDYIQEQYRATHSYYEQSGQEPRPWSFGEIYNSLKGVFALGGRIVRTPGAYMRVDPDTGRPTRKALKNTYEFIHPSVRSRSFLDAPGVQDRGLYESKAMRDYKLRMTGNKKEDHVPIAVWESRAKRKGQPKRVLRESPLYPIEERLLQHSHKVNDFIYEDPNDRRRRSNLT